MVLFLLEIKVKLLNWKISSVLIYICLRSRCACLLCLTACTHAWGIEISLLAAHYLFNNKGTVQNRSMKLAHSLSATIEIRPCQRGSLELAVWDIYCWVSNGIHGLVAMLWLTGYIQDVITTIEPDSGQLNI